MFKKLFDEMLAAKTVAEIDGILYRADGVDALYQREKITWQDHERLFNLAGKLSELLSK